jgi:hypothetical protein
MRVWETVIVLAAALALGTALYIVVRWRGAPVAFRALRRVAILYFLAGFLAGLWTLRAIVVRPTAPTSVEMTASSSPKATSSAASSETSSSEKGTVDPQLSKALLSVRTGIADFGDTRVGDLLNCLEHSPQPSRFASESDKGYGTYVIRLQNAKGEWLDLYFVFAGNPAENPATLVKSELGNGVSTDDWQELLIFVQVSMQGCGKGSP